VAAIELAGASPILVDIDPETFTLDPSRLAATVQRRVGLAGARIKAVIVVHLYGHPADMPTILDIAERHGLYVIEDCAQAHGARLDGRPVGGWGHLAAFSFYPTKNLGAVGDGGAVLTDDSALADRVRLLREYGWRRRYVSDVPGTNSRLDELQAAVLRVKLRHLDAANARRRQLAALYDTALSSAPVRLPRARAGVEHVYHQYVVRSERRDDLRDFLAAEGVGTLVHYPMPVHLQPAYRSRAPVGDGGLPHTEQVCREILSLPIGPHIDETAIRSIARLVCRWME
jgi:dTDP-4-amino-4,6-dideoxygalactose transaminase